MNPEQQERVVQVLVEPGLDGHKFRVGTGFLITKSRVLTCEHVLRGADSVKVRLVAKAPNEWLQATVVWPRTETSLDVAVLDLEPSRVEKLFGKAIPPVLGYPTQRDRQEWSSVGMPRAAASEDKMTWKLIAFGGKLYQPDTMGDMTLDVDCPPSDPGEWQGASGSPVMAADQLVAVSELLAFRVGRQETEGDLGGPSLDPAGVPPGGRARHRGAALR